MDINETIAANLTEWMEKNPALCTLKKVAARSTVGFGTVQRIKNAEGNITAKNMALIARAFNRHPAELMIARPAEEKPELTHYRQTIDGTATRVETNEKAPTALIIPYQNPLHAEVLSICKSINDNALREAIGYLKRVAEQSPGKPDDQANDAK